MARPLFLAIGLIHLLLAAMHFLWLGDLELAATAASVPLSLRHLLLLCTAAVGLLLAGFGVLAMRYGTGQRYLEPAAVAFALLGSAIWLGRTILEWQYPVTVPLLGIRHPSPFIVISSLGIATLYGAAWLSSGPRAQPCPVPASVLFDRHPIEVHFADSYEIAVPRGTTLDEVLAAFYRFPRWMHALMWVRDYLVALPLGIPMMRAELEKRVEQGRLFTVIDEGDGERLMGESDTHLDYQILAKVKDRGGCRWFEVCTRVRFHNAAGRTYFIPVRLGHRWLVPALAGRTAARLAAGPDRIRS
ncbi:MAG: DUF2867 domain-containing protein [Pseudomonadota bacterium]